MARAAKPSNLELLEYAEEGLRTLIGTHPEPGEWPEGIRRYEEHLKWVRAQIKEVE